MIKWFVKFYWRKWFVLDVGTNYCLLRFPVLNYGAIIIRFAVSGMCLGDTDM